MVVVVIAIVLTGNKGKKEIQQGEKTVINEEQYTEELADVTNTQNTKHEVEVVKITITVDYILG